MAFWCSMLCSGSAKVLAGLEKSLARLHSRATGLAFDYAMALALSQITNESGVRDLLYTKPLWSAPL